MWKTTTSGCGRRRLITETPLPFPDPLHVPGEMVAVGGNLSTPTLLAAYRRGIFPWYSESDPILWWCLDPRFVIFPSRLHVSRSLRRRIRRGEFQLTVDADFETVIRNCGRVSRGRGEGTWITPEMEAAYIELHREGYAHSAEAWKNGALAGGTYGVALGGCYYGESMFFHETDASKVAFTALVGVLVDSGFGLVDCQEHTAHLETFGAVDMSRKNFLKALAEELKKPTLRGSWRTIFPNFPQSTLWAAINAAEQPRR